jgi:hypothetical protein
MVALTGPTDRSVFPVSASGRELRVPAIVGTRRSGCIDTGRYDFFFLLNAAFLHWTNHGIITTTLRNIRSSTGTDTYLTLFRDALDSRRSECALLPVP